MSVKSGIENLCESWSYVDGADLEVETSLLFRLTEL